MSNERKPWTPEEDAIALEMKREGSTYYVIADELGRTPYAVQIRMAKIRAGGGAVEQPTSFWTPEKEAELARLWNEEKLPAKEIGKLLGCSKNAIVGKARRLKLDRRDDPIIRDGRAPKRQRARKNQHLATDASVLAIIAQAKEAHGHVQNAITKFHDCGGRAEECQWIDGEPVAADGKRGTRGVDYTFCCKPTVSRSSYCREHYNRCIQGRVRVEALA